MINTICSKFLNYIKCSTGSAFIELALAIPVLLIIFFGVISVTDWVRTIQKSEGTIIALTDVVSQFPDNATAMDINSVTNAIPLMMGFAYTSATRMNIILTDVQKTANGPQIVWQYNYQTPAATNPSPSMLGVPTQGGNCKNVSNNTAVAFMNNGDEVVFGEIYYQYQPIYTYILGTNNTVKRTNASSITINRSIFFLPRYANLKNVGFNTTNCTLQ